MTMVETAARTIRIGSARVDLQDVRLRPDIVLDEVHLEGGDVSIEPATAGAEARVTSGETRVRAVMSEANLNRLANTNLPADAPLRNLQIALLSGKARISGKALLSIVPFPFSVEATPRVVNGVRVLLDFRTATLGVALPRPMVEVLQQRINEALCLDVGDLEVPVWIDEIRCEPGRLTALGRARITWPPQAALPAGPVASTGAASAGTVGFRSSGEPMSPREERPRAAIESGARTVPGDGPTAT
jgi:hypothetical protein